MEWTRKLATFFKSPEFYLENLRDDTEIELYFKYTMPPELRAKFSNTIDVTFDVDEEHKLAIKQNLRSKWSLRNR
jgi:hypothetical protein